MKSWLLSGNPQRWAIPRIRPNMYNNFNLIFFGGEEDFKYRQHNDEIKNNYCFKHNINLIRLPYTLTTQQIEEKLIHIWNP